MNRVKELRRIRESIEALREEEEAFSRPIVANMGMIRNLYDVFCVALSRQDCGRPTDADNRKKFLYAILYLFSPATLVGGSMRHRMRENITEIIGCTPTGVSRDYKTAIFFYDTYNTFRESVDSILRDMLKVLGKTDEI